MSMQAVQAGCGMGLRKLEIFVCGRMGPLAAQSLCWDAHAGVLQTGS